MRRFLQAAVATAMLMTTAAATGAEAQAQIDSQSADDITLVLSKLAIETKSDEITPEAYRAAKTAITDALGCAMAGYQASGVPAIVQGHTIEPGTYDVLVSVGSRIGTPQISLPLNDGDQERRYRIGAIEVGAPDH